MPVVKGENGMNINDLYNEMIEMVEKADRLLILQNLDKHSSKEL